METEHITTTLFLLDTVLCETMLSYTIEGEVLITGIEILRIIDVDGAEFGTGQGSVD